jgi:hypothetical protein
LKFDVTFLFETLYSGNTAIEGLVQQRFAKMAVFGLNLKFENGFVFAN